MNKPFTAEEIVAYYRDTDIKGHWHKRNCPIYISTSERKKLMLGTQGKVLLSTRMFGRLVFQDQGGGVWTVDIKDTLND